LLCSSGGCLEQEELRRRLPGRVAAERLAPVLGDERRFTLVQRPGEGAVGPVVRWALTLPHSGLLTCRKECRFVHNFHSDHNLCVLKQHGLESLNSEELRQLLLQNDPSLLPEVCLHYNKGDGQYGSCTFRKACTKLHVCQYFLHGQCRFGSSCKRSHDLLTSECYEKLEKQGMSAAIIKKLPSIYRNMYDIQTGNRNVEEAKSSPCKERKDSSGRQPSTAVDDELEQICLYHLYKGCSFKDKCTRTHFRLPYRWQISDGDSWSDFKNMEEIEKAYSDPRNTRFDRAVTGLMVTSINFLSMDCGFKKVRRLSTASSVSRPPHFILTTKWIWYWKDEYGCWQEYGVKSDLHSAATVSSEDLEKAYVARCSPELTFKAGKHEYQLSFGAMVQKNLRYTTQREICRRPKYVSQKEIEDARTRSFKHTEEFRGIPAHWDKSALPDVGFKLIELDSSSPEYSEVKGNFQRTLPRTAIKRICRVQNPSLWELYQWQKEQMKKTNHGKAVDERLLFHGTSESYIDAICQQNFDWRICGLHGTVYGKGGSYFARDASYSDNYCEKRSDAKTMFLARVLVGEFTTGSSSYVRPPLKDNQSFYDSCVNDSSNPSIFVIFEKYQIYPEYLIKY
ncbi:PAR12 polymerase, partial [Upupa epops]|nr:PAR12 polymerase [Upupa epops]